MGVKLCKDVLQQVEELEEGIIKEETERKMRKIAASQQSPISSSDFAQYMKRNVEIASKM